MNLRKIIILIVLNLILLIACNSFHQNSIDLSGKWEFQIDSLDIGINQKWFSKVFTDTVNLPGSMLTNGKGDDVNVSTKWTGGIWDSIWYKSPEFKKYRQPGNVKVSFWLQPLKYYTGVAWYKKDVFIPERWGNRFIRLFVERCHWQSKLWIDSAYIGEQNALSAPHIYSLGNRLTPGKHTITIRVDNRINDINPGYDAHSLTDNTQTNWNGIIGQIDLISKPVVYISDIQIYPDVVSKLAHIRLQVDNNSNISQECRIKIEAIPKNNENGKKVSPLVKKQFMGNGITVINIDYPMGDKPLLWDEFEPNVYQLKAEIFTEYGADISYTDFGMRNIGIKGTRLYINNHPVFLRGTVECAVFPKTGYPSVNLDDWVRILSKCRGYGLNHVRFHSWCPPEAAFIAADKLGIYLSIENSAWAHIGDGDPIDKYIYEESNRIVKQYGNHPSFCLMPYGNEASGDKSVEYLTLFVEYWKQKDNRRLYTSSSGFPECPASDYLSSGSARIQWWNAGLTSPVNADPPTTDFDWTKYINKEKPTISHEMGQWCVYPDFREINQYDGVLKPRNYEIFRDKLEENHMLALADSFLLASGKLQVLLYKADIEAALRTPGFAGFQMLQLNDFPGQGTALVGILNSFWQEKGYVTSEEFRHFCNSTVPLLRLPKMIYRNNERICAKAELIHYGNSPLINEPAAWKITDITGKVIEQDNFSAVSITDGLTSLGTIDKDLSMITLPEQLKISVTAGDNENSWDIWVFPANNTEIEGQEQLRVSQVMDKETTDYLNKGGKVLLTIRKGSICPEKGGNIPVGFSTIFWNTQWTAFQQPPFTMGILCNPDHPALSLFPSEYHSNYQWWDAMSNCNAIIIDSVSHEIKPIVRIIDDWFTARPLALIFECRIGKGKLLVSGADLLKDSGKRYEAAQLLYSLKKYMTGPAFNPTTEVDPKKIMSMFK